MLSTLKIETQLAKGEQPTEALSRPTALSTLKVETQPAKGEQPLEALSRQMEGRSWLQSPRAEDEL